MINKAIKLVEACDTKLKEIENQDLNIIAKAEQSLKISKSYHNQLQELILTKKQFNNIQDEIRFFKEVKPRIVSTLIYWSNILTLETKRPIGSEKAQRKFFTLALKDLIRFWNQNLEFYQYYRSNNACLDHILLSEVRKTCTC